MEGRLPTAGLFWLMADGAEGYHWAGNVRELESVIERAVITSQGTALQVVAGSKP
ncbi:MAG: hypothetical protein ABSA86_07825 [Oryzomonas sp.]|jgi:transcriptional regulator with AAA-type ATPase domain